MAELELFKEFAMNMTDYISRHDQNYTAIEDFCNYLAAMLPGASTSALTCPRALQEIYDRPGLIGTDAFSCSAGVLTGPSYNLTVLKGAFWNGTNFLYKDTSTNVSLAGQATGTYYLYLDSAGVPNLSSSAVSNTIRQFDWDASTHTVSNVAIYSGISVLFDGDDYAAMLVSVARGLSFDSVTARLEAIELLLADMANYYGEDAASHSGLDFYYLAGKVRNDSVIYDTATGHVTLTDNATNYVEVDPTTGTVSANASSFTSGQVPLFLVVTASGAISTVTDKRTWAVAGTGGGGGGHTQNTDTGTTSRTFEIDNDAVGDVTDRGGIVVRNGSKADAIWAYNPVTERWEGSNDGGVNFVGANEFFGDEGAVVTRYIGQDDPDLLVEQLGVGSDADYVDVDVSSYVTAPDGLEAVALRVQFWDSSPGSSVNVKFKKKDAAGAPAYAWTVWQAENDAATIIVPVNGDNICQYLITASGADTANLRIWLQGYYKKVSAAGPKGEDGADGYVPEDITKTFTAITVGAGATVQTNLTDFINRGNIVLTQIQETGGNVTGTYDVVVFAKDDFTETNFGDKLYELAGVDPADNSRKWQDPESWSFRDEDLTNEMHIEITNNDISNSGTYVLWVRVEKIA